MEDMPEHWRDFVDGATNAVSLAKQGDGKAGRRVLNGAVLALRCWLQDFNSPDPRHVIFVRALLESLERIQQGEDAAKALHLKKGHRTESDANPLRDVWLWVQVGREHDRLTTDRGHTRSDKPLDAALTAVALKHKLSVATVKKAWSMHGAGDGWQANKSDWK